MPFHALPPLLAFQSLNQVCCRIGVEFFFPIGVAVAVAVAVGSAYIWQNGLEFVDSIRKIPDLKLNFLIRSKNRLTYEPTLL